MGAKLILSIYNFHKDVLSVNSTHSNITLTWLLSAPTQVKGYFLAFFMPQQCWVSEMNFIFHFLFQPENSIHREQAVMEIKLHKEVWTQISTMQHLLVQNLSVITDSHPSFQSVILLLGCVDKQTISHPRCMAILGKCGWFFLLIINIKIASSDSALLPAKHRNLE